MIREKIQILKSRTEIPKQVKIIKKSNSNVTKGKIIEKYEFYKCDYCNEEIRLDKKQHERSGGIVIIPNSITKFGNIKLALCNKCLKKVLEEFET